MALSTLRSAVFGLLALAMAIGLAGCRSSPARGEVSGKVTFKGKAVSEGKITFFSAATGDTGDADLANDGTYTVKTIKGGLIVGDYKVWVSPLMVLDKPDPRTPPTMVEKPAPNIPIKYRGHESPLTATIKEGKNERNFDMTP